MVRDIEWPVDSFDHCDDKRLETTDELMAMIPEQDPFDHRDDKRIETTDKLMAMIHEV